MKKGLKSDLITTRGHGLASSREYVADDDSSYLLLASLLPRLVKLACYEVGSDGHDIAAEALLIAYIQLANGNFRGDCRLSTWVLSILKNKLLEYWRNKRKQDSLLINVSDAEAEIAAMSNTSTLPVRDAVCLRITVEKALESLSVRYREIMIMKSSGWTSSEIAAVFKSSADSIDRDYKKARACLLRYFRWDSPTAPRIFR